jgi:hypothetical protein
VVSNDFILKTESMRTRASDKGQMVSELISLGNKIETI